MIKEPFATVLAVTPYVDTVEVFFRGYVPKGVRSDIERIQGRRVWIEPCGIWGHRICLNQPGEALIEYLATLRKQHRYWISRVDVAVDFLTATQDQADAIARYLRQHLILLRRHRGHLHPVDETLYWCEGRCTRNIALYASKPSRHVGDPCCHLELRFFGSASVRRAGFASIESLSDPDVIGLMSRHMKVLTEFDPDKHTSRIMRCTLSAERRQFMRSRARNPHIHPVMELFRSRLPHRVKRIIDLLRLDSAQIFKDEHPDQAKKLMKKSRSITEMLHALPVINIQTGDISKKYPMISNPRFH